ncbi:MAG: GNAT family N-acetyltransferase [Anaerolineae bacterium]|nr:GNAT family N-acetyltransferase [Anaerolineae bacterium]
MFAEIPVAEIRGYATPYPGPQLEMVIASIAEGNTRAQLWMAAPPGGAASALLWDQGNNVFYLSGDLGAQEVTNGLALLIREEIAGRARAGGLAHFKVHALSPSSGRPLHALFGCVLRKVPKLFFALGEHEALSVPPPTLKDVRFLAIDADLLQRENLENLERVRAEVEWMWPSLERYVERGFGCAALCGEAVVSWCTAEYVSVGRCGMGIETVPVFRNKGVGTGAAARFAETCLDRGIIPHWECDRGNVASIRVAEKLGFAVVSESVFWSGAF